LYEGFDVLRTKDLRRLEAAITQLAAGGHGYQTVMVDPLSVLWHILQDAGQGLVDTSKRNAGKDSLETGQVLSAREWGLIKRRYSSILTRLINLPLHVVLTARDSDLYEGSGQEMRRIGVKADVEKSTPYVADFVLACTTTTDDQGRERYLATVEKSRAAELPKGKRLTGHGLGPVQGLFATHFAGIAAATTGGAAAAAMEDDTQVLAANTAALGQEDSPALTVPRREAALPPPAPRQNAPSPIPGGGPPTEDGISKADLTTIRNAVAALGWGDPDKARYLARYNVRLFSDLPATVGATVARDLAQQATQQHAPATPEPGDPLFTDGPIRTWDQTPARPEVTA